MATHSYSSSVTTLLHTTHRPDNAHCQVSFYSFLMCRLLTTFHSAYNMSSGFAGSVVLEQNSTGVRFPIHFSMHPIKFNLGFFSIPQATSYLIAPPWLFDSTSRTGPCPNLAQACIPAPSESRRLQEHCTWRPMAVFHVEPERGWRGSAEM